VADAAGMVVSEDGLMAQVDVRAALTKRLQLIPLEHLEAQLTIVGDLLIQFQGVAMTPFLIISFIHTFDPHQHRSLPSITSICTLIA
jgi:hypothetical protein